MSCSWTPWVTITVIIIVVWFQPGCQAAPQDLIRTEMLDRSSREYVPLNSLTITSLFNDKPTDRPLWWNDLQQKRELYKTNKQRQQQQNQHQNGEFNNQGTRPVVWIVFSYCPSIYSVVYFFAMTILPNKIKE
jgi:hypothetical protein